MIDKTKTFVLSVTPYCKPSIDLSVREKLPDNVQEGSAAGQVELPAICYLKFASSKYLERGE